MTTVTLEPGICGLSTTITVEKIGGYKVKTTLVTTCPNLNKIPDEALIFNPLTEMTPNGELPDKLKTFIPHPSCAFTSALLKAGEVEKGWRSGKTSSSVLRTSPEQCGF